jgi:hypothetical protein
MLLLYWANKVIITINARKRKYVIRHQNAGQSHNITITNKYSENIGKVRCAGEQQYSLTDQNLSVTKLRAD